MTPPPSTRDRITAIDVILIALTFPTLLFVIACISDATGELSQRRRRRRLLLAMLVGEIVVIVLAVSIVLQVTR